MSKVPHRGAVAMRVDPPRHRGGPGPVLGAALRRYAGLLSRGAGKGRLNILIFHRVRAHRDPLFPGEPDRDDFDRLMGLVAENFHCIGLPEAVARLSAGRPLPPRAVAISFDDGYADNRTEAVPVLQAHGLTASFFVASGFLDGGCMWNDRVIELVRGYGGAEIDLSPIGLGRYASGTVPEKAALLDTVLIDLKYREPAARSDAIDGLAAITGGSVPRDLMMSTAQVREMQAAGMEVGGHTLSHPILARLDDAAILREIGEDRARLADILGAPPTLFAYPNGKPGKDYLPGHPDLIRRCGYRAAFSTAWGSVNESTDLFQVPRFTPWDRSPARFVLRLAHNYLRTACDRV